MRKKGVSIVTMFLAVCMAVSWNTIPTGEKLFMREGSSCQVLAASEDSINGNGTYHDNSWDGVSLKKVNANKDDSKKNLVHDFKVVKGKVKDTVTGKVVQGLKVCKNDPTYFVGDNTTRIALNSNWDETIEAIIDYDEKKLGDQYPVFYTYIPSWIEPSPNASFNLQFNSGVYNLKFERASADPYQSHWLSIDSNFLRDDGLYVYEKLPKRDIFVAVATDYTNQKSYARINGTATNVKLENKGNAYKYYRYALQEMVVTSNHKIKELKIYSDVRNADQLRADYKRTGIASTIKEKATGTDGIVGLGCTVAWTLDTENNLVQQDVSNKKAGVYQVKTKTGAAKTVGIAKYNPVPDKKVSNKGYQSLHITNKRKTILKG